VDEPSKHWKLGSELMRRGVILKIDQSEAAKGATAGDDWTARNRDGDDQDEHDYATCIWSGTNRKNGEGSMQEPRGQPASESSSPQQ